MDIFSPEYQLRMVGKSIKNEATLDERQQPSTGVSRPIGDLPFFISINTYFEYVLIYSVPSNNSSFFIAFTDLGSANSWLGEMASREVIEYVSLLPLEPVLRGQQKQKTINYYSLEVE